MTKELIEASNKRRQASRGGFADRVLMTTIVVLIVSLAIAAIAVSIGIARAG